MTSPNNDSVANLYSGDQYCLYHWLFFGTSDVLRNVILQVSHALLCYIIYAFKFKTFSIFKNIGMLAKLLGL